MPDTTRWTVIYYQDSHGHSPVEDFMYSLQPGERAIMLRLVDRLERYGVLLRSPYVEHVEGPIWELRAEFGGRVFYFAHTGRRFVLLHGYRKKSQKAPRREIETALRRWEDVLRREIDG